MLEGILAKSVDGDPFIIESQNDLLEDIIEFIYENEEKLQEKKKAVQIWDHLIYDKGWDVDFIHVPRHDIRHTGRFILVLDSEGNRRFRIVNNRVPVIKHIWI